jgi:hypothetical protein
MKKLILTLIIIFVTTNSLYAAKFNWTRIVTTIDNATEFYIDKKSVRKVGKFHYYWMMANYLKLEENDNPDIKSNITYNILNCETGETKKVTFTSFSLNKGRGEIDIDIIIPDEDMNYFNWQYYDNTTSFGMVFEEVCKSK